MFAADARVAADNYDGHALYAILRRSHRTVISTPALHDAASRPILTDDVAATAYAQHFASLQGGALLPITGLTAFALSAEAPPAANHIYPTLHCTPLRRRHRDAHTATWTTLHAPPIMPDTLTLHRTTTGSKAGYRLATRALQTPPTPTTTTRESPKTTHAPLTCLTSLCLTLTTS